MNEEKKYAETYLGSFGTFLPLLTMITLIIVMSLMGMRSSQNFFAAGFIGMSMGFLTFKDKDRYMGSLINGIRNPMFATMTLIFYTASVFAKVLQASQVANSLVSLMQSWNIPIGLLPVACFLMACVISTASGSSSAALSTLLPIMMPLGVQMGIDAGLMAGVIASGAIFGDNLSPISDSTIASTQGVGADLSRTLRDRIKYSAIAFVPAVVLFLIQGIRMAPASGGSLASDGGSMANLVFLILPVLILVMILKKANFIVTLLTAIFAGIIMLFAFGLASPQTIVGAEGVIISGFTSQFNTIAFMMMIFIVMSLTESAGGLQIITKVITRFAKSERSAEAACGAFMCLTTAVTGSGISSMGFCGPLIAKILAPYKISLERMANFINGFGVAVAQAMVPYSPPAVGIVATCIATGVVDNAFTPFSYLQYNYYGMMLFLVYWIAILTGFGRDHVDTKEN